MPERRRRGTKYVDTEFSKWLYSELERRDINFTGLGRLTGVADTTARGWALGKRRPNRKNVQALSKALNISAEDILRKMGDLPKEKNEFSSEEKQLLYLARKLRPAAFRTVVGLAENLLAQQEQEGGSGGSGPKGLGKG